LRASSRRRNEQIIRVGSASMDVSAVRSALKDLVELLRLGRFHFLFGGVLLFITGVELAVLEGARFDPTRSLLGYLVLFGAHLSVSYSNDRFDMAADRYNTPSAFSGGSGVLTRRPDLAGTALGIAILLIVLSIASAIAFSILNGFDPVFLGLVLAGNFLGWSYTGPPLRLAYRGLGEVSTAVTVGMLVTLFGHYSLAGELSQSFWIFVLPQTFYGMLFIITVQLPDADADALGGKRTFVTSVGRDRSIKALVVLASIASASIFALALFFSDLPFSMFIIGTLSLIPLAAVLRAFMTGGGRVGSIQKKARSIMNADFLYLGLVNIYLLLELTLI